MPEEGVYECSITLEIYAKSPEAAAEQAQHSVEESGVSYVWEVKDQNTGETTMVDTEGAHDA